MNRLKAFLFGLLFVCAVAVPALSEDRSIIYPNQIIQSTTQNQNPQSFRVTLGTFFRDLLGPLNQGGVYTNMTITPMPTGLYVYVQPGSLGANGVIYQMGQNDPNPLPVGFTPQLPADTTQIMLGGFLKTNTGQLGPLTAPSTVGYSVYYLLEAQLNTIDTTPVNTQFINAGGQKYFQTVNTIRTDQITFQLKAGTASASPSVPATDTGWISIGTIIVAYGATGITSGNIAMSPAFLGFATANVTVSNIGAGPNIVVQPSNGPTPVVSLASPVATACPSSVAGFNASFTLQYQTGCAFTAAGSNLTSSGATVSIPTPSATACPSAMVGMNAGYTFQIQNGCAHNAIGNGLATPAAPNIVQLASPVPTACPSSLLGFNAAYTTLQSQNGCAVTSVAAGNSTVVIGGTAQAPTVAVTAAPSLTALTLSGLSSGLCVQTGTGGLLTTAASACTGPPTTVTGGLVTYLLQDTISGANGSAGAFPNITLGSDGNYYAVRFSNSTGPVTALDKIAPASGGAPPSVTTSNSFTDATRFTASSIQPNILYVSGGPNIYLLTYNGGASQDYVVKLTTALAESAEYTIPITSCNPRNPVTDGTNVYFFCTNASNYYLYKMTSGGTFTNLATVPQQPGTMVYDSGSGDLWITTSFATVGANANIYKYTTAGVLSATYNSGNVTGLPSNASHAAYCGIAFDGSGLPWVLGSPSTTVTSCTSIYKLNSNSPSSSTAYASAFSTTASNNGGMSMGLEYGGDGNMYAPFYTSGSAANCPSTNECLGGGVAQILVSSGAYTYEQDDRPIWSNGGAFPDIGPWDWAVASNVIITTVSSGDSANAWVVTTPYASFSGQTIKQTAFSFSQYCVAGTLLFASGPSLCTTPSSILYAGGSTTFTGWTTVSCTFSVSSGGYFTSALPTANVGYHNFTSTGFQSTSVIQSNYPVTTGHCIGY